jgi:hypothetical protein
VDEYIGKSKKKRLPNTNYLKLKMAEIEITHLSQSNPRVSPYWLSVHTAGKMWENERLKNVENSNLWIFGYPKRWKNDVCGCLWIISPTFFYTRVFSLIFFFLLLIVVYAARSLIN